MPFPSRLLAALLACSAAAAMAADPPKPPTLAERKKAVQEQIEINKKLAGKPAEEQLKIAKEWAKKHRTAMAPAALSDELNQAYAFRSHMSGDPQCQEYAHQADNVFLDNGDEAAKVGTLNEVGGKARAAGCVNAP
jgi:hypothetical protein